MCIRDSFEDVPLLEFMYPVLARMPGESYRRGFRSPPLRPSSVERYIIPVDCWSCTSKWQLYFCSCKNGRQFCSNKTATCFGSRKICIKFATATATKLFLPLQNGLPFTQLRKVKLVAAKHTFEAANRALSCDNCLLLQLWNCGSDRHWYSYAPNSAPTVVSLRQSLAG